MTFRFLKLQKAKMRTGKKLTFPPATHPVILSSIGIVYPISRLVPAAQPC
jgi:hypothetical protein